MGAEWNQRTPGWGCLARVASPRAYVSGHVRGGAAGHAWVEAWDPGRGRVGIDPADAERVYGQEEVKPPRGMLVGAPEQELEVTVSVRRIG